MSNQFRFSATSEARLATVHPYLVEVVKTALATGIVDFAVVCGSRTKAEQDKLLAEGKSKLAYPKSKHNVGLEAGRQLSAAVDIAPVVSGKIRWDRDLCCLLAGVILATAHRTGGAIRWGGNWDMDGVPLEDQGFDDLVHFEIVNG